MINNCHRIYQDCEPNISPGCLHTILLSSHTRQQTYRIATVPNSPGNVLVFDSHYHRGGCRHLCRCSGGALYQNGEGGIIGPTPSPSKLPYRGLRSHFGEEGVKAIIPPSPLFVPPKQNDRLADIYKAVLPCLGRWYTNRWLS